jgi:hypothetical protein
MGIEHLIDKVGKLTEELQSIKIVMAENSASERQHQKNVERFWNSTWPETIRAIQDNKLKLAEHDVLLARVNTKLTLIGSLAGFAIPFLIYYLRRYGGH